MTKSTTDFLSLYEARIAVGEIQDDLKQRELIQRLSRLVDFFLLPSWRRRVFLWLLRFSFVRAWGKGIPRGLYIHGSVGCGKTMLMDMFFGAVPFSLKGRFHFHEFMLSIHKDLHYWRSRGGRVDPITLVCKGIGDQIRLLCLDEVEVTDIADAMVLGRLFSGLIDQGVIIVATSNEAPEGLYKDGLNRVLFLPFILLLRTCLDVHHLDGEIDYRIERAQFGKWYIYPAGQSARLKLDQMWQDLGGEQPDKGGSLSIGGRSFIFSARARGMVRFSFSNLCGKASSQQDYLWIAQNFHTLFLDEVPYLTEEKINETRRFISLIDVIYDHRVRLVLSAADKAELLCVSGSEAVHFSRTISRLIEMNTSLYQEHYSAAWRGNRSVGREGDSGDGGAMASGKKV